VVLTVLPPEVVPATPAMVLAGAGRRAARTSIRGALLRT
jgi:hypothetical protein